MHEELDKFLDKLMVVFEKDERPGVAELSDIMTKSRQDFLSSCLQHMIEERYSAELSMEESPCPRCCKSCTRKQVVRKKLETAQGTFELRRPWFYCPECEQGVAPLDAAAEISRRQKQFDIQKKAVKLAAQVPFCLRK
jgi:Zn finger protein HypA/HybF involved in hydrogenase expression